MATEIPKIEYKNGSTSGTTTSGSGTIGSISDTSLLEAGMFIEGTGIPSGAEIGTVSANEIILANGVVCTSSNTDETLTYGFRIQFEFPPKEPKGELYDTKANVSESLSGVRQVSVNYIEAIRQLNFSFLTQAIYDDLDLFLSSHALLGESFRYFGDWTNASYVEYELESFKTEPRKITGRSVGTYVWEVPLKFRRAI